MLVIEKGSESATEKKERGTKGIRRGKKGELQLAVYPRGGELAKGDCIWGKRVVGDVLELRGNERKGVNGNWELLG